MLAPLLASPPGASSQALPVWRFWTSADGLTESYTRGISAGPDGRIWLRHGAVSFSSSLDGYGVAHIPEPPDHRTSATGPLSRVYVDSSGDAWEIDSGSLQHYSGGRWNQELPRHSGESILAAVPDGAGRILVLFAGRLAAYSPPHHSWSTIRRSAEGGIGDFTGMEPGLSSDFWITGTHGIARLEWSAGSGSVKWMERDTSPIGVRDLAFPLPAPGLEVFAGGRVSADRWAVVRWQASHLEIVYSARQDNLRGWRGPDDEIWVLNGASLLRQSGGQWIRVRKDGLLSGTIYDVLSRPDGSFWLGTSEGAANCERPAWQTPRAVGDLDSPVHTIAEDRLGRIWFSATEYLLEFDGTAWRRYRLPSGLRTHIFVSHNLMPLADGRIAVKARGADALDVMLLFDPATARFETLAHPQGRRISLMSPRHDGTMWVVTKPGFRIETWDTRTFHPLFDFPSTWTGDDARALFEGSGGEVWIGGSAGAAVWRNGAFHMLGPADGFDEKGTFDFFEFEPGRIFLGGRDRILQFDGQRWSVVRSGLERVRTMARMPDGALWVASGSGLHWRRNGEWITNGVSDGLPSEILYAVFQDSKGRIWAGTSSGLSLYHPDVDREAPVAAFKLAASTHQAGTDGNARVFFSGTDRWKRTSAGQILFSSRLDSSPWAPFVAADAVSFYNLSPGRHHVQLRAMDRNGNMQQAPGAFEFSVAFPWYRQSGFLAILVLSGLVVAVLLAIAVSSYRQRGILIVQLDQARLAAESASRYKGQFLANMSHEIRTPMNAIIGMTRLALEVAPDDEQREYLGTVQKAADALLALLNDILDFSKVEAGKLELAMEDFDLQECAGDVVRTFSTRAQEKGLTFTLQLDPGVPRFLAGDDLRLRQILLNLAGNAIKFTAAGHIRILVRPRSQNAGTVALEFVVFDTGIGIHPGKQEAIFAPFEQEDGSTTRKYGGSGLGLAICAKLVGLMHGQIWVESPWRDPQSGRETAGSAFHFTAQFRPGKAPACESRQNVPEAHGNLRILLAEDNTVNRLLAVRLLERRGHTVLPASNGLEALQVLEHEKVDAVFMDIQMPEMDGFEAARAIREREKASGGHIPIVALTAHAMAGDKDRCLDSGMDNYLSKPIRTEDLDRVLSIIMRAAAQP